MKKKILFVGIILISIFSLYNVSVVSVKADSGFDTDYGSSGSGGSSSGSWSGSDSGGGDFSSSPILDTIFIVTLIIFFTMKHFSPKDNTLSNSKFIKKIDQMNLDAVPLNEINKYIKNFNSVKFMKEIYKDFIDIQNAWMDFDYEKLSSLLTDELYNQYVMQLDTLKVKNECNKMSDFTYHHGTITGIMKENDQIIITINLFVSFYDYIDRDGVVVRGNSTRKVKMIYEMTYISEINNNIDKCPHCGASITNNASQRCEYCGCVITNISDKWVLSKKEAIAQEYER